MALDIKAHALRAGESETAAKILAARQALATAQDELGADDVPGVIPNAAFLTTQNVCSFGFVQYLIGRTALEFGPTALLMPFGGTLVMMSQQSGAGVAIPMAVARNGKVVHTHTFTPVTAWRADLYVVAEAPHFDIGDEFTILVDTGGGTGITTMPAVGAPLTDSLIYTPSSWEFFFIPDDEEDLA